MKEIKFLGASVVLGPCLVEWHGALVPVPAGRAAVCRPRRETLSGPEPRLRLFKLGDANLCIAEAVTLAYAISRETGVMIG